MAGGLSMGRCPMLPANMLVLALVGAHLVIMILTLDTRAVLSLKSSEFSEKCMPFICFKMHVVRLEIDGFSCSSITRRILCQNSVDSTACNKSILFHCATIYTRWDDMGYGMLTVFTLSHVDTDEPL